MPSWWRRLPCGCNAPLGRNGKEKVFCKIDCEGAEKEIVPSLEMSGLLHRIHVLMMEWHFSPPKSLIDILTRNGFTVFFDHSVRDKLGFIKAVRV